MKKYFRLSLIIAIVSIFVLTAITNAQNGKGHGNCKNSCTKFVDANGDGKCDNFVDTNADGKCDNCSGTGTCDGSGNGQGKHKCGKFIDSNGDGKCDNFIDANTDGKCDNCTGLGSCDGTGKGMGKGQGKGKGNCGNGCRMNQNNTTNTVSSFTLNQNVPNPVIGTTKISFNLKSATIVKIILSDKLGNKVKDIFEGSLAIGDHDVDLNVAGLNPGNYFYSVYVGGKVETKQLVVIK